MQKKAEMQKKNSKKIGEIFESLKPIQACAAFLFPFKNFIFDPLVVKEIGLNLSLMSHGMTHTSTGGRRWGRCNLRCLKQLSLSPLYILLTPFSIAKLHLGHSRKGTPRVAKLKIKLRFSRIFQEFFLGFAMICQHSLGFSRIFQDFWDFLGFSRIFQDFLGFHRIF